MKTRYFLIAALIILATLAASAWGYASLPERVAVHWNADGQIDRYGSKLEAVMTMPIAMVAVALLFAALPWLSPRKFEVHGENDDPAYLRIMLVVLAFLFAVHLLLIGSALDRRINMATSVVAIVCALFAALGAFLPRLRRNFYVGVRTPWTLASDEVWHATHVFAAKCFIAGGILGLLLALITHAFWAPFGVLMVIGLAPIIHSLVYYKQLEQQGKV